MISEEKAYSIALKEILKDFPYYKLKTMYDIDDKYLFVFDNAENFVLVDKNNGKSSRIHFLTAMLDYPDIESYPKINFNKFLKRVS